MNQNEFKLWFKEVEQYFPAFCEWLKKHDFQSMLRAYFEELTREKVTYAEAKFVLTGWLNGRIEGAPVGFECQQFLRNLLKAIKEARSTHRNTQERNDRMREILADCEDIPSRRPGANKSPLVGRFLPEFKRIQEMNQSRGRGMA
jgi:UTP:GlnB (protein PII) uridylyltransferase